MYWLSEALKRVSMSSSISVVKRAYELSQAAAKEGFDWESAFSAANKVKEELEEVIDELQKADTAEGQKALQEEIGDLFLACICLSRHCGVEPEEAIELGVEKFLKRYKRFKAYANEKGISLNEASEADLRSLWNSLKERNN